MLTQIFHRIPFLTNRQVPFFRPQNCALKNLSSNLFQLSGSKNFTSTTTPQELKRWNTHFLRKTLALRSPSCLCFNWKRMVKLLFGGGATFLGGDLLYFLWAYQGNERRVRRTIERGSQPKMTLSEENLIHRTDIEERLQRIFKSYEDHSTYYVIYGEGGIGKTTLAKTVANKVKNGVIYIDIPTKFEKLGDEFGRALNFTFKEDASVLKKLRRKFSKTQTGNDQIEGEIYLLIYLFI